MFLSVFKLVAHLPLKGICGWKVGIKKKKNVPCWVSYRSQDVICHKCGEKGHIMNDCQKKEEFPPIVGGVSDAASKVFLDGVRPTRKTPTPPKDVNSDKDGVTVPTQKQNNEVNENGEQIPPSANGAEGITKKAAQSKFDNAGKATLSSTLRKENVLPPVEADPKKKSTKKRVLEGGEESSKSKIRVDESGLPEEEKDAESEEEEDMDLEQHNSGEWDVWIQIQIQETI